MSIMFVCMYIICMHTHTVEGDYPSALRDSFLTLDQNLHTGMLGLCSLSLSLPLLTCVYSILFSSQILSLAFSLNQEVRLLWWC